MSNNYIITITARKKMMQARAGSITLPKVVGMAFGSGGVDSDGTVLAPEEGQTGLRSELYRKEIDGFTELSDTVCRYECTLAETELVDTEISEIGLYDADGDIVCIMSFKAKGKDADLEMMFQIDDEF